MLLATSLGALPAFADESCHRINLRAVVQNTPENNPPDGGLTSTSQIRGGGLLQGTTEAIAYVSGFTPPATLPFVGDITFITNTGTLTVSVAGELDLVSGAFWSEGPVTDTTGELAGATGRLRMKGVQNLEDPLEPYRQATKGYICLDD